jgi:hypothetical protein
MLTFLLDGKKISLAEESKWLFPEAMLLNELDQNNQFIPINLYLRIIILHTFRKCCMPGVYAH